VVLRMTLGQLHLRVQQVPMQSYTSAYLGPCREISTLHQQSSPALSRHTSVSRTSEESCCGMLLQLRIILLVPTTQPSRICWLVMPQIRHFLAILHLQPHLHVTQAQHFQHQVYAAPQPSSKCHQQLKYLPPQVVSRPLSHPQNHQR
jgi:hypothetical protein